MNVELPDGTVIQDIPEGTTKAQLAERLTANGMKVPKEWMAPPPEKSGLRQFAEGNLGAVEAGAALGTRALSGLVGMGAGVAGLVLPGERGQGQRYMDKAREWLAPYEPQTEAGKNIMQGIDVPLGKVGQATRSAGEWVADKTDMPYAGAVTEQTLNYLPALVSRGAKPKVDSMLANVKSAASRSARHDETLAAAQKEGFLIPSDTMVGKTATSIGGKAATTQEITLHNQEVGNKIARREAGLGPDEPITETTLKAARNGPMSQPYRDVAAMSPVAADAWKVVQDARYQAKIWRKHYDRSADPASLEKAKHFEAEAASQENLIDGIAQGSKNPVLLGELRKSRRALAKNYDVDNAVNVGDGNIDMAYIGRRLDSGAKMSDGLELIGRFAQGPGRKVSREAAKTGVPGAGHLQAWGSLMGAIEGFHAGGIPGALVGGLAVPTAVGLGRAVSLSKFAQPKAGTSPGLGLKLMDVGTRPIASGAAALTPSLGLQPPREEY